MKHYLTVPRISLVGLMLFCTAGAEQKQDLSDNHKPSDELPADVSIQSFIGRLRAAAISEAKIVQSLTGAFDRLSGMRVEDLSLDDQKLIRTCTKRQQSISKDIQNFETNLTKYLAKTENEDLERVLVELRKSGLSVALHRQVDMVAKNQTYKAIVYGKGLEKKLHWLADQLAGKEETKDEIGPL